MKYDRTEIAPSGKARLCIYLSEDDADILDGLAKNALQHMPITIQTAKTTQRLRSMVRCFREIRRSNHRMVSDEDCTHPDGTCMFCGKNPCRGENGPEFCPESPEEKLLRRIFGKQDQE
jgi:hypothetical protein